MKTWIVASELIFSLCVCAANDAKVSAAMVEKAKAAAAQGDATAQFRYAEMLRDGRGVAKDVREAVVWTRKAAEAGHVAALCQMTHVNA